MLLLRSAVARKLSGIVTENRPRGSVNVVAALTELTIVSAMSNPTSKPDHVPLCLIVAPIPHTTPWRADRAY